MEAISKTSRIEKIVKLTLVAIIGTALITISAKIKIPFYPVPMTMQTFVILLIGITLGYKMGLATVGLYLFEGIIGLPVFASSPEKGIGIAYFIGPTMGYLIGFLVAVYFTGLFKYDKGIINTFLKLIFSVSFIYILGLVWLGVLIGWDKPIFKLGAQPFLLAELLKILLLLFLTPMLLKVKKLIKIT
ncbi:MAG: biotin transporter BioY [Pelagibacteraceae bacterium]|jgi:biotin transport system substrate-specific component|nr:BioY family transporter [Candidatus Pelagibacter sp.]MDP6680227.1 biotin transporter BioY [Pelagibacteraceae bacterium]MDP6709876.1 biotin transporter BioY [Pelagibacteraceae bacterium]|tara:strand:- start:165 stop:728 length:564 start_codon:yes stop_codon:yes gene_type:complete